MTAEVRLIGYGELLREMRKAGADMGDLKTANATAAAIVALYAQQEAPKRSGRLAATGRGNRSAGKAVVTFGRKSVPYAGPIHFGWGKRNIRANKWIYRAVDKTESIWLPLYERDLQKILNRIERQRAS